MCCKNKQARREAHRQARCNRREARCERRAARRAYHTQVVYERRPGLIRMLVDYFSQSRNSKRAALQQPSAYEPMPQTKHELEAEQAFYREKSERIVEQEPTTTGNRDTRLPSYGEVMKHV